MYAYNNLTESIFWRISIFSKPETRPENPYAKTDVDMKIVPVPTASISASTEQTQHPSYTTDKQIHKLTHSLIKHWACSAIWTEQLFH